MAIGAPLEPPGDITLPRPGGTTARSVLSRAIGRLFGDLRDVLRRPHADAAVRRDVTALNAALTAVPDRQAVLGSVLRRPNVGALVRCARLPDADPALTVELVATIAIELAAMGALRSELRLERAPARIVSLAAGVVIHLPPGAGVVCRDGSVEVAGHRVDLRDAVAHDEGGVRVRRPFHRVTGSIVLALEDNNPLSMFEAHPDKTGNRIDLGGRDPAEWCDALRDALDRIGCHLPDLRAEHDLFVQQFVPVGFDAESHLSASYREAIGTIYLTLHPQPMTMTEAVVHEFSHNKINALFELDEVLHNAYAPLYKSPVRPDPRPLHGVLLAVHAFIPVARLYEAMREADDPLSRSAAFAARFAQIVAKNREGMEVLLAHADPTPVGRAVLDELDRWNRHFG